jgi:hypothetical protein
MQEIIYVNELYVIELNTICSMSHIFYRSPLRRVERHLLITLLCITVLSPF